jgi:hypothetical protein
MGTGRARVGNRLWIKKIGRGRLETLLRPKEQLFTQKLDSNRVAGKIVPTACKITNTASIG